MPNPGVHPQIVEHVRRALAPLPPEVVVRIYEGVFGLDDIFSDKTEPFLADSHHFPPVPAVGYRYSDHVLSAGPPRRNIAQAATVAESVMMPTTR